MCDTVRNEKRLERASEDTVRGFFADKCAFITGATGFCGKVLLECLLRTCPEIKRVYIIVRPKKGSDPAERTEQLLKGCLFSVVREQQPKFAAKVVTVAGDLTEENFGLSDADLRELRENVDVVFHCAASVAFNDPLPKCVDQNVIPVRKFLALARSFRHLRAFVHVSTAYSNCNQEEIKERVYPHPKIQPEDLVQGLKWLPEEAVDAMTPTVLEDWPNTYTYTKQMGEYFVMKEGSQLGLPCSIVRPSIVSPIAFAPLPGWTDSRNGPTGFFNSIGMGILRVLYWPANARVDLVPVDVVANMCVAVAWETARLHDNGANLPEASPRVYNCTAAQAPPLLGYDMADMMVDAWKEIGPPKDAVRAPKLSVYLTKSFMYYLHLFIAHTMYALGIDTFLRFMGQRPMFLHLYHKVGTLVRTYTYFMNGSWRWEDDNVQELKKNLNKEERSVLRVDIEGIDWRQYLLDYCNGIKTYMAYPQRPAEAPRGRRRRWILLFTCLLVVAVSLVLVPSGGVGML